MLTSIDHVQVNGVWAATGTSKHDYSSQSHGPTVAIRVLVQPNSQITKAIHIYS